MARLTLPMPFDDGDEEFQYSIAMDNREYILRFTYMGRQDSWYLSIFLPGEVPVHTGIRLVPLWVLNLRDRDPRMPAGILLCLRQDEQQTSITFEDMPDNFRVYRITGQDLKDLAADEEQAFVVKEV